MRTNTGVRVIPIGTRTDMRMAIPMQSQEIMSMDIRVIMELMSTSILDDVLGPPLSPRSLILPMACYSCRSLEAIIVRPSRK